jgi:hypothetical protein
MILLCGSTSDLVLLFVRTVIEAKGFAYRILDPYAHGECERPRLTARWAGGCLAGCRFEGDSWNLDGSEITGVFARYFPPPGRACDSEPSDRFEAERIATIAAVLDSLPCLVVNRVYGGATNHSKPLQAGLIARWGLGIPETLVTNQPNAAREFANAHSDRVIYKSVSGVRSIVRAFDADQKARLPLLRHGPAQFQAFVDGANVRVHVVGERVFATRIDSDVVDYRFADAAATRFYPAELPPRIARACVEVARALDLPLVGIDLKETPSGNYVCFEANPCPAFPFYEQATGQPICATLVDLLQFGADQRPASCSQTLTSTVSHSAERKHVNA